MSFQTTYGPDGRLRVAILGCTGSIGTQALDVCRQHADRLQVTALSVNSSTSELVAAAREFSVPAVAVADVAHGDDAVLQELPEGTQLGVGAQAVCELARRDDVDCVLVAIVGAAGLEASHAALTSNKRLALANKESSSSVATCLCRWRNRASLFRSTLSIPPSTSAIWGEPARGPLHLAHLLGRSVLWPHARRARSRDACRCPRASHVGHGCQDHH